MEKDNPQPNTQPSGNKPPPRPPTRTAIGMLPDDDDPEKNRRNARRENVRIHLPPKPMAEPSIQLPLLPGAITATPKKPQSAWPLALLLVLAIWVFIGAVVAMVLYSVFSDAYRWDQSRNLEVGLILLLLWAVPAQFIRWPKVRAGKWPFAKQA